MHRRPESSSARFRGGGEADRSVGQDSVVEVVNLQQGVRRNEDVGLARTLQPSEYYTYSKIQNPLLSTHHAPSRGRFHQYELYGSRAWAYHSNAMQVRDEPRSYISRDCLANLAQLVPTL